MVVNVRLIIAGIILLTRAYMVQKDGIFRIWKNKRHVLRMLVYGVIGIAGCQMTYYLAVEDSNAGIATVLQYTAPVMIMVLLALKNWKLPGKRNLALILHFAERYCWQHMVTDSAKCIENDIDIRSFIGSRNDIL